MSDNQRRAFCRILFLAVCVLPTSAIGYWIFHPQTAGGWERAIQAQLGVKTKIDSVETPGPYVTILRGLEFFDPDGKTLLKTVETRIEYGGRFNKIIIPHKVHHLTNEGLAFLINSVNQHVIRNHSTDKHWKVVCEEDAIVEENTNDRAQGAINDDPNDSWIPPLPVANSLVVSQLQFDIGPSIPQADGTFAEASFKVVGSNGNVDSGKFVICKMSKTDQYGHVMELNTNDSALPCWLVAHLKLDLPSTIGSSATFNGDILFEQTSTFDNIEVSGVFKNVDLGRSVAGSNQNRAEIRLNNCKFENGQLKIWDALLKPDSESMAMRIDEKYLFKYHSNFDVAWAILSTLSGTPRTADRDVDLRKY